MITYFFCYFTKHIFFSIILSICDVRHTKSYLNLLPKIITVIELNQMKIIKLYVLFLFSIENLRF